MRIVVIASSTSVEDSIKLMIAEVLKRIKKSWPDEKPAEYTFSEYEKHKQFYVIKHAYNTLGNTQNFVFVDKTSGDIIRAQSDGTPYYSKAPIGNVSDFKKILSPYGSIK